MTVSSKNKKRLVVFALASAVFLSFLFLTSPYRMPLLFVIIPVGALIVGVHSVLSVAVSYAPVHRKTARTLVHVLTLILAVVLVLLSVGQLTLRDFSLLLAFALIGSFYLSRMLEK